MIEATDRIQLFIKFLTCSWDVVIQLKAMSNYQESFVEDWQQANWELLVELALPEVTLVPYGGGADMDPTTGRATRPEATATHVIACLPVVPSGTLFDVFTNTEVGVPAEGFKVDEFVSFDGAQCDVSPPFDHVLTEDSHHLFRVDRIRFVARPILEEEL